MKIGFRTTASREIGFGHLRRCLTLAQATGAECVFFVQKEAHSHVAGFEAREWTGAHDCDVLVCDDYSLDGEAVRGAMVLDDPAERALALARWIVNPVGGTYHTGAELLLGLQYALVREEFRGFVRQIGRVERILVTLGGADPGEHTLIIAQALQHLPLEVVIGPLFSERQKRELPKLGVKVHLQPPTLADLMKGCDLVISAGGQTLFEIAATGLPAVALCVADNQANNLRRLSSEGVVRVTTEQTLQADVQALIDDVDARRAMSATGQARVDGRGAERVAEVLR